MPGRAGERRDRGGEERGSGARRRRVAERSPRIAVAPFEGKRGLVLGVANKRSIAWAIAQRLADEGAQLAFTYQGERIEKSVRELAETVVEPARHRVRRPLGRRHRTRLLARWARRSAAGSTSSSTRSPSPRPRISRAASPTRRATASGWRSTSARTRSSPCARAAEPLMEARGGGSILTMTYLGGERAVPHYNVMGVAKAALDASVSYLAWDLGQKNIRVNAVSAGPGAHAGRALDRRLPDDGGDRRGARAAPPPHRRRRRRRRGRVPALATRPKT